MRILITTIIFFIPLLSYSQLGYSFKQFENTPVHDLAKACDFNDLEAINDFMRDKLYDADYGEEKFGQTVLMVAVMNNKHKVIETLLKNGANPNKRDKRNLTVLMRHMSVNYNGVECDVKTTKLLIQYGADINAICDNKDTVTYEVIRTTAFMLACESDCLANIKYLVAQGVDINKSVGGEGNCAITNALIQDRIDLVKYLIIDLKAKIPPYCLVSKNGDTTTVLGMLRLLIFTIGSKEHKVKMEIVSYLNTNYGLDYFKEPLPKGFYLERMKREHPNDFDEYIKKY